MSLIPWGSHQGKPLSFLQTPEGQQYCQQLRQDETATAHWFFFQTVFQSTTKQSLVANFRNRDYVNAFCSFFDRKVVSINQGLLTYYQPSANWLQYLKYDQAGWTLSLGPFSIEIKSQLGDEPELLYQLKERPAPPCLFQNGTVTGLKVLLVGQLDSEVDLVKLYQQHQITLLSDSQVQQRLAHWLIAKDLSQLQQANISPEVQVSLSRTAQADSNWSIALNILLNNLGLDGTITYLGNCQSTIRLGLAQQLIADQQLSLVDFFQRVSLSLPTSLISELDQQLGFRASLQQQDLLDLEPELRSYLLTASLSHNDDE